MKRVDVGLLVAGLWAMAAPALAGGGYYLNEPGGRNVVWPPPGGVDAVQPPLDNYGPPPTANGYRPAWRWYPWGYPPAAAQVPPPGPDWPQAQPVKASPLQPGQPVEVVPPPGIPVEDVEPSQAITRQPHHEWRPVDPEAAVQRATVKPPARPDLMRPPQSEPKPAAPEVHQQSQTPEPAASAPEEHAAQ